MEILVYLLLVVAGVVIGIAVGRLSSDRQRIGKVEAERDAATQALADYRQQVTDHFQHTGELFDRITADYRSLYEHLASGATELCDVPRHDVLQSEPERRRLTEPTETDAGAEARSEGRSDAGDAARAGAAAASVGAAAAAAAATTDSTPAEADAAAESETETDAATKQAEETASAMPEAAAPEEAKASEEATAPEEATASEEAVEPKPAEATAGDGEVPADDDQPGVRDGDDKPPLSVNGHYRADEGADLDRKPGAP